MRVVILGDLPKLAFVKMQRALPKTPKPKKGFELTNEQFANVVSKSSGLYKKSMIMLVNTKPHRTRIRRTASTLALNTIKTYID